MFVCENAQEWVNTKEKGIGKGKRKMKKTAAIILAILIAFGWYVSICGIGPVKPLKDQLRLGLDMVGGVSVVMEAQTDVTGNELRQLMSQTQAVIESRVNEMGLSEPVITIEGENRIRVELPGEEDADNAIKSIGRTAQLRFVTADGNVVLDGSSVKDANAEQYKGSSTGLLGSYVINLTFDNAGAAAFEEATRAIMSGEITSTVEGVDASQILITLDDKIISNPAVHEVIASTKCQITGQNTKEEASNIAALIRGGALPVSLKEVETQVEGPTLGLDAAKTSLIAGGIGVLLILLLMVVMYNIMGISADIALLLYVLIVFWVLVAMKGVLTLPGIAGMILSIGMAVDANVIIFSRIKEEVIGGKSIRVAVDAGFKRAMSTIIDSQVTTIIAAIILYQLGTGPVRGFAMTLMIGIFASLFTAVVVTQLYLGLLADSRTFGTKKFFAIKEANKNA